MMCWKNFKGSLKFREPLRNKTTFKIGGPARFFVEPKDYSDLKLLRAVSAKFKLSLFVLGSGSNILVSDKGLKAIVLRLNSPFFKKASVRNNFLEAGSGLTLSQLLGKAARQGLSGIEFLAGIPGTLGGALIMNAGAWGKNIGDLVQRVEVMDKRGNKKSLAKKDIRFAYRKSSLAGYIVLSARLRLAKKTKREILSKTEEYLNMRKAKQDLSSPSAGCVFKNPCGVPAARLIDLCGLKGRRIGDACVSPKHANFIVNLGRAKSGDVLKLISLIRKKVHARFNLNLSPELKVWS